MADFEVEVFYDGACPLCMREIRMLRRRDRNERIRFNDIAAESFDPAAVDLTWEALMERIHGRLPDGTIIEGVEVFRRLYAAVGFRTLATLSRAPGVSHSSVRFSTESHPIALDGLRPMGQGSPALEFPSKAGHTAEPGARGGA